jgi:polysaccharide export outer membrane protein
MTAIGSFGRQGKTASTVCVAVALMGMALAGRARAQAGSGVTSGVMGEVTGGLAPSPGVSQSAAQAAASAASAPVASPSMLYPGEDFRLAPGDLIAVHLFGALDYSATVRVGLDGTVALPYVGTVPLQGLSVRAAQGRIEEKLRAGGFYNNPQITIQVVDTVNGSVTITGEVRAVIPVSTERSLREVLLAAGGLPPTASHTVKIVRPGVDQPIVVNLGADLAASAAANVPVHPHDIIQISRANVVYVLGAFKNQGSVPLDQASPLTLMELAALSGGVGWEGRYADLRLVRTVGTERKLVDLDIKKVLNGKAPDPVLEANDIVFLPTDQMKAALKSLGIGGVLGLVSLIFTLHNY